MTYWKHHHGPSTDTPIRCHGHPSNQTLAQFKQRAIGRIERTDPQIAQAMHKQLTSPPDNLNWEMSMTQPGVAGKTQHLLVSTTDVFVTALERMSEEPDGVQFGLHMSMPLFYPYDLDETASDRSEDEPACKPETQPTKRPVPQNPPCLQMTPHIHTHQESNPVGLVVEYTLYVPLGVCDQGELFSEMYSHGIATRPLLVDLAALAYQDLKKKVFAHLAKECETIRLNHVAVKSDQLGRLTWSFSITDAKKANHHGSFMAGEHGFWHFVASARAASNSGEICIRVIQDLETCVITALSPHQRVYDVDPEVQAFAPRRGHRQPTGRKCEPL
ncbi:hypothetical protein PTTG_04608 [Puccinia triticina 1-1 BBBD Race 1]|uniref:Uncharacterized protein n=2 Tax=Puccinia triticina TaxID=208348 RepID=A0A180GT67_PUCT1|nr:uncharacterized protein PtA15_10A119 [Puccinia triticina]OAV95492.1 hypothetical protein PTTG_04608 [Puccinia triticina 1-1 BBBD Race 1]WAQ88700.1 hypothetical protein PtA15_10A119 [Puccinia triticina]